MILLDTNIISEMMKEFPNPTVLQWLKNQNSLNLYTSAISIAEIHYGINVLPEGKKHHRLEFLFTAVMESAISHRVLVFDERAAFQYAKLMAKSKKMGLVMTTFDAQIAAIALHANATLVTRNTKDFAHCDLPLINPFEH